MTYFIDLVRALNPAMLVTEEAACDAYVKARWPDGVIPCLHCGSFCQRHGVQLHCTGAKRHRLTIFFDTPLGSKRRPNARATFLALRHMTSSPRSISARELARETAMPIATCWRHLHSLRSALPIRVLRFRAPVARQAARTWINGTFHGISKGWRHRYDQELASRWTFGAQTLDWVLDRFFNGGRAVTLRMARRKHGPSYAFMPPPPSTRRRGGRAGSSPTRGSSRSRS